MRAAIKYLLLIASFNMIFIHLAEGDYYTDESYEDGKTFYDYADKWYGDEFFNGEAPKQPGVKPDVEVDSETSSTEEQKEDQSEEDENKVEVSLFDKLVSSILGLQVKLVEKTEDSDPNDDDETVDHKWGKCFRDLFGAFGWKLSSNTVKKNTTSDP